MALDGEVRVLQEAEAFDFARVFEINEDARRFLLFEDVKTMTSSREEAERRELAGTIYRGLFDGGVHNRT